MHPLLSTSKVAEIELYRLGQLLLESTSLHLGERGRRRWRIENNNLSRVRCRL